MAAKRRPSFSPEPPKSRAPATDWVYRSDAPAPLPAAAAAPPAKPSARAARASTAAARPRTARPRRSVAKTGALLMPIALVHVCVVEPLVGCVRRWLRPA
jgi:hypothetical protein